MKELITKTLLYRIISLTIITGVLYLTTLDLKEAFQFSIIIETIKCLTYFVYEYVWTKINES